MSSSQGQMDVFAQFKPKSEFFEAGYQVLSKPVIDKASIVIDQSISEIGAEKLMLTDP